MQTRLMEIETGETARLLVQEENEKTLVDPCTRKSLVKIPMGIHQKAVWYGIMNSVWILSILPVSLVFLSLCAWLPVCLSNFFKVALQLVILMICLSVMS